MIATSKFGGAACVLALAWSAPATAQTAPAPAPSGTTPQAPPAGTTTAPVSPDPSAAPPTTDPQAAPPTATPPTATPPTAPPATAPPATAPPATAPRTKPKLILPHMMRRQEAAPPPATPDEGEAEGDEANEADAPPPTEAPRRRTRVGFGGGFGYFASSESGTGGDDVTAPGVALELHSGFPVADDWKVNLRFNWGLTEFHRSAGLVKTANAIGEWTTGAYVTVWEWGVQKDEYALFRVFGALFASVGLLMPYAVAGVLYVLTPFAPTTYLGCDITASYHLGEDNVNAFIEAGLGLVSYIHPKYGGLYGGAGPTVGFGTKLGFATVGVHGTWSPPGAHGEPLSNRSSNIYIGGLTVTFGN